ncbi:hypothetical protein SAMN05216436_10889 [bacterium A37T11]|nr:hypothetical protein SAMN05216436_10889 [bacterium A37T11]
MKKIYLYLSFLGAFLTACTGSKTPQQIKKEKEEKIRPKFEPIAGTMFFEVRRSFDNGLAFDTIGFEQEPQWQVNFINNDSVKIFSPDSGKMLGYSIYYDQDSIFNFGREWFRVKNLAKDSLLLQRLQVQNLHVKEKRSNVYMKLYAANYIKDVLHTTVEELRKPRRNDSVFIKWLADRSNRNATVIDSAFSSKNVVELKSINPHITVKRHVPDNSETINASAAYYYLYPEYDIEINKCYKNFYDVFSVLVDGSGDVHLAKVTAMPEFEESKRRVLTGVINVYLKHWLSIKPAVTLGFPHTSLILLRVRGKI